MSGRGGAEGVDGVGVGGATRGFIMISLSKPP